MRRFSILMVGLFLLSNVAPAEEVPEVEEVVLTPGVMELVDFEISGQDEEELNNKVRPAVVRIRADGGFGTGFVIDDGLVVATAWHVVDSALVVEIETLTGERRTVELLAFDRKADVALLRLEEPLPDVVPLELADEEPFVGYTTYAIGHPFLLNEGPKGSHEGLLRWSFTKGMVSVVGEKQIQTTVVVHPGNSGGPLFDARGKVVGVVVERYGLFGLARKIDIVRELLEQQRDKPQKRPVQFSPYLSPIFSLQGLPATEKERSFTLGVGAEIGFLPARRMLVALRSEWSWVI
ncbi:MAG: trypsin-like peptidase domain-containing protein, partial [Proteobacteria bacterium]|nr:trypsin-like peptidase domain-containing protein [Pseudomonadota bacterium]